jgi:hypothetical protein
MKMMNELAYVVDDEAKAGKADLQHVSAERSLEEALGAKWHLVGAGSIITYCARTSC